MATSPATRFKHYVKIDPQSGCWLWQGAMQNGYPMYRLGYAHRFAYEHIFGPLPEGARLRRDCNNRGCVNPAHITAYLGANNPLPKMPLRAQPQPSPT